MTLKSEIVENYLSLSKQMDSLLNNFKMNLQNENRQIIGITQEMIDRIIPVYTDDKNVLSLGYKLENEFILNAITFSNEENEENPKIENLFIELARINFVNQTLQVISPNVIELLDQIIDILKKEKEDVLNQQNILKEQNKKFWFRIFHRQVPQVIDSMNEAIRYMENIEKSIEKEKHFFFSDIKDKIINDFSEVTKYTYGLMNLRRIADKNEKFVCQSVL